MLKLFIFLLSFEAFCGLKPLLNDFLKNNLEIQRNEKNVDDSQYDFDAVRATRTWGLDFSLTYTDNDLENGASFNAANLITEVYNLSLTKDFEFGTSLSLENNLSKIDKTRYPSVLLGDNPAKESAFEQTLSLSQNLGRNLLGRQFYLDLESAREQINLAKLTLSDNNQAKTLTFYTRFLDARLRKTVVKLEKEALKRAQRRVNITRKKVRDGLNERVDLLQAQISLSQKEEDVERALFDLKESLLFLSNDLERKVLETEIEAISFQQEPLTSGFDFGVEDNLNILQVKSRVKALKTELRRVKLDFYPEISLNGSYTTNHFDTDTGEAYSQGTIGSSSRDEISVALSISVPLGFEAENAAKSIARVQLLQAKLESKQLMTEVRNSEATLKQRINSQQQTMKSSRKSLNLAQDNLKENNRLYNIGRTDFDGLIRSEETLISAQRRHVRNWYDYEVAMAQKVALYGKLLTMLDTIQ